MKTLAGAIAAVAVTVALTVGFVANQSPASGGRSPVRLHGDAVGRQAPGPPPRCGSATSAGRSCRSPTFETGSCYVTFMDSHLHEECGSRGISWRWCSARFRPEWARRRYGGERNPAHTPRSAPPFARLRGCMGDGAG